MTRGLPDLVRRVKLVQVSDQRTSLPDRVSIDDVRDLIKRRRDAGYDGTWLLNEAVEALLTEAELYRLKHDASYRRQRDAARAQRETRKREPVKYDD